MFCVVWWMLSRERERWSSIFFLKGSDKKTKKHKSTRLTGQRVGLRERVEAELGAGARQAGHDVVVPGLARLLQRRAAEVVAQVDARVDGEQHVDDRAFLEGKGLGSLVVWVGVMLFFRERGERF